MTAHAVEYEHHRRILRDDYGSPILVVLAVSERGNFGVFNFHFGKCPPFGWPASAGQLKINGSINKTANLRDTEAGSAFNYCGTRVTLSVMDSRL